MNVRTLKITKLNIGLYRVEVPAHLRTFEVEDNARVARENGDSTSTRPDWQVYEIINGRREWWNDFATKATCLAVIRRSTT